MTATEAVRGLVIASQAFVVLLQVAVARLYWREHDARICLPLGYGLAAAALIAANVERFHHPLIFGTWLALASGVLGISFVSLVIHRHGLIQAGEDDDEQPDRPRTGTPGGQAHRLGR